MFNWLFRNKEEIPTILEKPKVIYSEKGVAKYKSKRAKPWYCYLHFRHKGKKIQVYIGSYLTKQEAQKARFDFIENLK